ncbi:MAG TPA: hypothetical protein PLT75_19055 [Spirochaetota bacterium]|nr:hypothetical protein [Spirochaetota bacterium]
MIKKTALLVAVTFSASFFFCTARQNYRTKDIRFRIEQSKEKLNKFIDWSETEKNKQEDIYNRLVAMSGNSSLPPYPELKQKIEAMKKSLNTIMLKKKHIESLTGKLETITTDNTEITPDDPRWERAQQINEETIIIDETIEKESSTYKKETQRFSDILKEYNIIIPDADKLRQKLQNTIHKMNRNKTGSTK